MISCSASRFNFQVPVKLNTIVLTDNCYARDAEIDNPLGRLTKYNQLRIIDVHPTSMPGANHVVQAPLRTRT
jgi:hypothetical protein